jgi:hypothetical protein
MQDWSGNENKMVNETCEIFINEIVMEEKMMEERFKEH